eukprot:gene574-719_t
MSRLNKAFKRGPFIDVCKKDFSIAPSYAKTIHPLLSYIASFDCMDFAM